MSMVRSSVNFVQNRPTLVAKVETRRALIVQRDGHQQREAPSVNLARLELLATSKVKYVVTVTQESIVKVKRVMVRVDLQIKLQILRNVLTVRQDGHPRRGAPSVKPVELEHTAMAVNRAH